MSASSKGSRPHHSRTPAKSGNIKAQKRPTPWRLCAKNISRTAISRLRAPNSLLSIRNIGVQLFPRQLDFFLDAYRQATARPYGYLLIDMHASSDPSLRLRTNIFKDEQEEDEGIVVFIPKNGGP
ncbi:hypothetical protein niasHT_019177 [Heterodera trifolii]|uniref:Uncharacterized protein n=1 Tax=Heterodera trifolii TaxID=157864 RepID=A0ABD2LCB9_9BILA